MSRYIFKHQYEKKPIFANMIIENNKSFILLSNLTSDISGLLELFDVPETSEIKNILQYIVIIEVIKESVSKSFKLNVLKGFFFKLTNKNAIKIMKTISA